MCAECDNSSEGVRSLRRQRVVTLFSNVGPPEVHALVNLNCTTHIETDSKPQFVRLSNIMVNSWNVTIFTVIHSPRVALLNILFIKLS